MRNAEVQRGGWQPRLIKAETTMESAKHRKAAILTTDYRMNADRGPSKCGMGNGELIPPSSPACAEASAGRRPSPPGEGGPRAHRRWRNAGNDEPAKPVRNGRRSSRLRKIKVNNSNQTASWPIPAGGWNPP